jgi:hypothetical protein
LANFFKKPLDNIKIKCYNKYVNKNNSINERWYLIMANKMTQKDWYAEIVKALKGEYTPVTVDNMIEFINDRVEKLSKKSSSKKPTKTQVENEGVKDTILEVLAELDVPTSATALATDPRINVSNQKVSALLRQLIEVGKVVRIEKKGKALFSVAED